MNTKLLALGTTIILGLHIPMSGSAVAGVAQTTTTDSNRNRIAIQVEAPAEKTASWYSLLMQFLAWVEVPNVATQTTQGADLEPKVQADLPEKGFEAGKNIEHKDRQTTVSCSVKIVGAGRMKALDVVLDAKQDLNASGLATIKVAGPNLGRFSQTFDISLKAGQQTSFTLAHTNIAANAALQAEVRTGDQTIVCN